MRLDPWLMRSTETATRNMMGRPNSFVRNEAGCGSRGTGTVPRGGSGITPVSTPGPSCCSVEPRFWITNDARIGRAPIVAWKFVPKSTANAPADVEPSLSLMNLSETPAENRSEKFRPRLPEMNVSFTEYTRPSPSGFSTVYTGWSPNPNEPTLMPTALEAPPKGKATPAHVYLVSAT